MKKMKWFVSLLILLSLFACAAKNSSIAPSEQPKAADNYQGTAVENSRDNYTLYDQKGTPPATADQKIILAVGLDVETKDYAKAITNLEQLTKDYGGYIQYSMIPRNPAGEKYASLNATYNLMIPTDKITDFVQKVGEFTNIVKESRNATNITDAYVDTEARIANLKAKEVRLKELLKQSGNLSDLLQIETELSNTRYNIEAMERQLQSYDTQIQYTQVNVSIMEVYTYTPDQQSVSLWDRIVDEFKNNWKNFGWYMSSALVFVVSELPFILLQLVLALIPIYLLYAIFHKKIRNYLQHRTGIKVNNQEKES